MAGGDAEADGQLAGEALLGKGQHGLHQQVRDDGLDDETLPPRDAVAQPRHSQAIPLVGRRRHLERRAQGKVLRDRANECENVLTGSDIALARE